jgi:hypothetical protein
VQPFIDPVSFARTDADQIFPGTVAAAPSALRNGHNWKRRTPYARIIEDRSLQLVTRAL